MKKFRLLFLMMALFPAIALVSCDDDDDGPPPTIRLKEQLIANPWKCTEYNNNVKEILDTVTSIPAEKKQIIYGLLDIFPFQKDAIVEFKSDNKFYMGLAAVAAGDYSLSVNMLTVTFGDYGLANLIAISGEKLTMAVDKPSAIDLFVEILGYEGDEAKAVKEALSAALDELEFAMTFTKTSKDQPL